MLAKNKAQVRFMDYLLQCSDEVLVSFDIEKIDNKHV